MARRQQTRSCARHQLRRRRPRSWPPPGAATERRPGCFDGVDGVGLAVTAAGLTARAVNLDHRHTNTAQEPGQSRPIRAGGLDNDTIQTNRINTARRAARRTLLSSSRTMSWPSRWPAARSTVQAATSAVLRSRRRAMPVTSQGRGWRSASRRANGRTRSRSTPMRPRTGCDEHGSQLCRRHLLDVGGGPVCRPTARYLGRPASSATRSRVAALSNHSIAARWRSRSGAAGGPLEIVGHGLADELVGIR